MSTISQAIVADHRKLEKCVNEVTNNPGNQDHQQAFGNQFVWELARHSVGEELVVYPAMDKHLGEKGREMTESDRREHHSVKQMLKEFQDTEATDPHYVKRLKMIWERLTKHIKEEEHEHLPALEKALESAGGESQAMARSFERTKLFVPTRSHPSAGEHPPFETAMGLLAAPIDRVADLFRKFPDQDRV
ncbi:HHE domain containing protein [Metarhizium album ARSEF 1941]|uniref:HHE domain containing protein n=1 Tax=Metarhizium album (strain ARSEF 1941) TaxID=1081103 RepID=A0A0B2WVA0_METAS|nr:HHE domain containing protein [Metarhizium album ARSEF 1941]KHN96820.1 HHE domain containing protein [Metarhizium album ARSEF 1941]